ncbi:hypothetical protein Veis_0677 [Verminephrobacter eiseniae EF01-2]|uniref:Uncharacterized protein n=2 Tax=Verminephrobacter eiseniae TaxID=364317 RepID=A1WFQ2_VEREI|nr:hypothetical protein Veis_0677 [Verminephrobacter eiseniae EF01-2]MCW5286821.1 hypothetical protein [Verminephrobacter eiseniae]MCW8178950.1 hypothetical protein [Verminephrobacter eiseniae]
MTLFPGAARATHIHAARATHTHAARGTHIDAERGAHIHAARPAHTRTARAARPGRPGIWRAAAVAAMVALTGCAAPTPASPEQAVEQRANARWKALLAGDIKQAYGFITPSYRAVTSLERYSADLGGVATWIGAQVVRVECATEKCTAVVKIEAKPIFTTPYRGTITTAVDETWLLEDGQWWLYQKL